MKLCFMFDIKMRIWPHNIEVTMIYEKCRDILLRECELVHEASAIQEKLKLAVIEREWTDFESHISAMNNIENKLASLEDEREQLFLAFETLMRHNVINDRMDAKGRFYAMVCLLPENQRNDLTSIYRSLKLDTLRLRMANEAFMIYLAGIKSTLKDFFECAFPERAGKIYTRDGTHLSHDMRSMVLNRSF